MALYDMGDFKTEKIIKMLGSSCCVILKSQPPSVFLAAICSSKESVKIGSSKREMNETAGSIQRSGDDTTSEGMDSLTAREQEIVRLVASGLKNKEVADRLHLSDITVRHHLTHIFN